MMTLEQLPPKGVKREQAILELGKDEANGELLFQLVNTEKGKCKTAAQKALAELELSLIHIYCTRGIMRDVGGSFWRCTRIS